MTLKEKSVIMTHNRIYIVKAIIKENHGVVAIDEDGYDYFIEFKDIVIINN